MSDQVIQEATDQVSEAQNVEATQQTDKENNFRAITEKTNILERQNQYLQQKIMEMERRQQEPQTNSRDLSDDDVPTYGDLKRELRGIKDENTKVLNKLRELETRGRYDDYEETIQQYLPDVLKEDPELAEAIQNNPAMHKLAYRLAKSSDRYHESRLAKVNQPQVDRIVENTTRPTPSTGRKTVMVQDENARIESMTDAQIMEMFQMAKAR